MTEQQEQELVATVKDLQNRLSAAETKLANLMRAFGMNPASTQPQQAIIDGGDNWGKG